MTEHSQDPSPPTGNHSNPANKLLLVGTFLIGVVVGAGLVLALDRSETPEAVAVAETTTTATSQTTTTTVVTTTTTTTIVSTTTTAPIGDTGSRENPVPLGALAMIGSNWEVSVIEVVADAEDIVAAENQFNDPPPEGSQFVMAGLSLTYQGTESSTPWLELSWQYLGPSNVASDEDCGVTPDQMFDVPEMFPGGTAVGNICQVVATGDVGPDLLLILEESFSFDESRVFFSLTE